MLEEIWLEASKFENVLQSLRVKRGKSWTQERTAKLLTDYDQQEVKSRLYIGWENGEGLPSPENLRKIVAVFGLSQDEEEALYRAAGRVPQKIRHLPFPPNPYFTGRKTYLEQLRQFLQEDSAVALTQPVSLSGLGGIGKSQLALAYAYKFYPKVYRVVLWVNAADGRTLQADFDTLAQTLGLPEQHEDDPKQRVRAVKRWLGDHTHWLLIMDNADNLQLARSFFPEVNHGHILLTTRSQSAGKIGARQIEIDKMEPEEGLLFLLRRSDPERSKATLDMFAADMREAALQVVELLDGHPLALDQAGAYIEDNPFVSFTDYINLYYEKRHDLLSERGSEDDENEGTYSDHPESVVVTFELCFEMACKRHPLATDILRFCAYLQPDAIPEELFRHDDGFKLDAEAFKKGIKALFRYSLLKLNRQEKTCSLHRLVQAVVIDGMSHDLDLQKQWKERVVLAQHAAFPELDPVERWPRERCERLLPHVWACSDWPKDELTPIVVAAKLYHKVGSYLTSKGQPLAAEYFLNRVLPIYEQHIGVEHADTVSILNKLAALYNMLLNNQDLFKQLTPETFDPARSRHNLVYIYLKQGKYEKAVAHLLQLLPLQIEQLGADHPDVARDLGLLAALYHELGNYKSAELFAQLTDRLQEQHLETEHPDPTLPLYVLAALLYEQGQDEQSEALLRQALGIQEQQLGATDPHIQAVKREYAGFMRSIGRDAEAAALEVNDEPSV